MSQGLTQPATQTRNPPGGMLQPHVATPIVLDYFIICCSVKYVRITFDPVKNDKNVAERGLSFELVAELDWESAIAIEDTRKDYGEKRLRVFAPLDGRLHAAVITMRDDTMRVISFRRANQKEIKRYEQEKRR